MAEFFPRERARLPTNPAPLPAGIGKGKGGSFSDSQHVSGMAGLARALEQLKTGVARAALRKAGRTAGEVVRAEAESRAPVGDVPHKTYKGLLVAPGYLQRHVVMKTSYRSKTGILRIMVGPTRQAFYGSQWVELGKSNAPKQPWLVPSLEAKRGEAVEIFVQALRAAIMKAVAQGKTR